MFSGIKLCLITSLVLFVLKLHVVFSAPQVPCYFSFGDSTVDNGNNNDLITPAKSNYQPYGIDFVNGPTGRSTNGKTVVDFISKHLGFDEFIPPFATARGNDILKGVVYGSSAAGILVETGSTLNVISLFQQLVNHLRTVSRIRLLQGNTVFTNQYLSKCLYTVSIGSADYIANYLNPVSVSRFLSPEQFADRLITTYDIQLKTLYYLGARKVAIFSIGLLGCIPQQIALFGTNGSACVDSTNAIVKIFDDKLKLLVQDLNCQFRDAKFTYINVTSVSYGDPSAIGVTLVNATCCATSIASGGLCIANSVPCNNRNEYMFYDTFHQTEVANNRTATRSYIAQSPFDAYPVDISHLVQL